MTKKFPEIEAEMVNIKNMTADEHREWLQKIEAATKKVMDKWNNKIAPEPRKGDCRVCTSIVTEDYTWAYKGEMRYGGPNNGYWKSSGLYCIGCGIKYAKLPK